MVHSEYDEAGSGGESLRTVMVAAGANLGIALAKGAAALLTGSASLWAETVHSVADTGNEVLLFVGLRRSTRREDAAHPFGWGQERFFWAFLAALGIFLVGGLLSIGEGVRSLLVPEPLESPWIGIVVLVVAAGFEGYSWQTARRQLQSEAVGRRRSMRQQLRLASDPSAGTVFLEDSAALAGLALALVGLVAHVITGWSGWEALASMAIGLLLMVVAGLLARRSKALLTDESAPPDVIGWLHSLIVPKPWVGAVELLDAVYVGPSQLLVIVRIRPANGAPGSTAIRLADQLRQELLGAGPIAEVAVTLAPTAERVVTAPAGDR